MAEINAAIAEKITRFLKRLSQSDIRVDAAYLYGSYAKGLGNKWSDIDLAVVSPDFSNQRFDERVRLMKLAGEIDSRIEPIPFCPETFVEEDPLVWEIKKTGLKLFIV